MCICYFFGEKSESQNEHRILVLYQGMNSNFFKFLELLCMFIVCLSIWNLNHSLNNLSMSNFVLLFFFSNFNIFHSVIKYIWCDLSTSFFQKWLKNLNMFCFAALIENKICDKLMKNFNNKLLWLPCYYSSLSSRW